MLYAPIKLPPFDLKVFFDARWEGWGVSDQVTEIVGKWNGTENKCDINFLELQG